MKNNLAENRTERRKAELLAPAGTPAHLRAAVNSGADAVYAGGKRFSARAGAGNFDDDEMREAAEYCRLRNTKLYVTINTLIFDDEMSDALKYAQYLYETGVDALIVQDLGFASLVRKYMPDFPLHLSTQGTVYSKEGVLAAARLGFPRIVLAREVSVSDMRGIQEAIKKAGLETELEVFVHGALCFCFSGQCQMSRMRGGRSGNRGACAQPCRLPYYEYAFGGDKRKDGAAASAASYKLSPKDLCSIDFLGELTDLGISSLKIEGRMKSPEYVAAVVSIYRKYMDIYAGQGFYSVTEDDRRTLSQIFNRGGFTDGYFHGNPGEKLMSGSIPKHQGVKIGRVVRRVSGKGDAGKASRGKGDLIEVIIDKGESLNMGDGVEIRNSEMPGNVVTYIKEAADGDGISGVAGGRGRSRRLIIGDIRGRVNEGDEIYKITDKALMEKAALSYVLDRDGKELTVKRCGVSMKFSAHIGERAVLTVTEAGGESGIGSNAGNSTPIGSAPDGICVSVESGCETEEAVNKPVTEARLREQLAKTGGSVFFAEDISIDIDKNISIPMSAVNALRREALQLLTDRKKNSGKRVLANCTRADAGYVRWAAGSVNADICADAAGAEQAFIYVHKICEETADEIAEAVKLLRGKKTAVCIPVKNYMDCIEDQCTGNTLYRKICALEKEKETVLLPYISNASMGREDDYVRSHFTEIAEAVKKNKAGIMCGNLGWLCAFADAGCSVTAGFGLNAANSYTSDVLKKLGACSVMPSLELAETDDEASKSGAPYNIYGAMLLMTSEHILPEGEFFTKNRSGDKEQHYISMTGAYGDKSLVLRGGSFRNIMIIVK